MKTASRTSTLEPNETLLQRRAEALAAEVEEEQAEETVSVLLFRLGDEWYALEVECVHEIYTEYVVTPLPCLPEFVLGVVNIRGEIISVTDLGQLMRSGGAEASGPQAPAVVIGNDVCCTALVVDEIGDIADVPVASLEPPLSVIDRHHAEFVAGAAEIDGRMVGLLNVDRILTPVDQAGRR